MTAARLTVACLILAAAGPATRPDAAADILGLARPAATNPTTTPAPPSPFAPPPADPETRPGTVTLSDGTTLHGTLATTAERPVRIWVPAEKQYEDVALSQIATATATVVWEKLEPEWTFAASGSDRKVYSGRSYPARQTRYTFKLADGTTIAGDVAAPFYLTTADGHQQTLVLHKRDKGRIGQPLKQLIYVARVDLK